MKYLLNFYRRLVVRFVRAKVAREFAGDSEGDDVCCCGDSLPSRNCSFGGGCKSQRGYAMECRERDLLSKFGIKQP